MWGCYEGIYDGQEGIYDRLDRGGSPPDNASANSPILMDDVRLSEDT